MENYRLFKLVKSVVKNEGTSSSKECFGNFEQFKNVIESTIHLPIEIFLTEGVPGDLKMFVTEMPLIDTSLFVDCERMFAQCVLLKAIPPLNTFKASIMTEMFAYCFSLETVPVLDTHNVTSMRFMFDGCAKLTDESLNNILQMCINAKKVTPDSILMLGLSEEQAARCRTLSNWPAAEQAGWTTDAVE